jgi:Mrp family chromosome partitioning ATPase
MDPIRQAVERARAAKPPSGVQVADKVDLPQRRMDSAGAQTTSSSQAGDVALNVAYLQSKRIIAYNGADQRSRPYDMLRTQVLQSMGAAGWKILAVTSPTPGCGKTLTALNLAFSIARQPDQSVVLVDLDLQKPLIAESLGLAPATGGALDVLEGRSTLASETVPIRAGNQRMVVVPAATTRESSELMGSRQMRDLLQEIRRSYHSHIVILDLPPILSSDDVIALLPQIDCVLLVTAVGTSKVSEIEECNRHLQSSHLVRLVVNKSTDANANYYYY